MDLAARPRVESYAPRAPRFSDVPAGTLADLIDPPVGTCSRAGALESFRAPVTYLEPGAAKARGAAGFRRHRRAALAACMVPRIIVQAEGLHWSPTGTVLRCEVRTQSFDNGLGAEGKGDSR
jgi:acyl-CoA synthetase (AMP-forming)/AMP-acid ligase II